MNERQKIEISTISILKFFGIILALFFLYWIRDILLLLFIVLIIVAALDPMVGWAEKRKIPRLFSSLVLYLFIFCLFILSVSLIFPPIIEQLNSLSNNFPYYIQKISPIYFQISEWSYDWQNILNSIYNQLSNLTSGFYNATLVFFGGLFSLVTVLVLSFYLLLERQSAKQFLLTLIPQNKQEVVLSVLRKVATKIGSWLRGQVIVSLTMGLITAILLSIAGVPYALTIGVVAAVVEIVPIIGAVIIGILAVVFTFIFGGWLKALIVLAVYIVIQQAESNILIPKVMGKIVGLSPVIIIIALLIGAKLAGIVGAILAIPMAAGLSVLFQEWPKLRR